MSAFNLIVLPLALGLVGSTTPCALGINAVFLGYMMGKERWTRLWQGSLMALARAFFLMLLGLLFAFIGEQVKSFMFGYNRLIAFALIALGALLVLSYHRPLSLPGLNLGSGRFKDGPGGALALGAAFGLDIPACTSPMVLALLAQTVFVGDLAFGAITLFLFGVAMSLPVLVLALFEGTHRAFTGFARRWKAAFYHGAGLLLILVGVAELSPRVMGVIMAALDVIVGRWVPL
jgi:cytochrome c-type biogenesis protein